MSYADFLASKDRRVGDAGFDARGLPTHLFGFQRDITRWAIRKGRAAIFADCGMGKTAMQLEWARQVRDHTGGDVLVLAPLAVASQTADEGRKFGVDVNVCRTAGDWRPGINVTNYDRLEHFADLPIAAVVLDESSIIKEYTGKTTAAIIDRFRATHYRLACTATPAPNDWMELGTHAEFLGICTRAEMLATFFVHDGGETQTWRLKGHAEDAFWRWVASWAVVIRKPSDIGHSDDGLILPPIEYHEHIVESDRKIGGRLFVVDQLTLEERREARKLSLPLRIRQACEIVNRTPGPWIVWCDLNAESESLTAGIDGAVEVRGSDTAEHKEASMLGFSRGEIRVLVTKPSIAGFGMNWQHCANVMFVGLSDSYEAYYQAVRRCWRFGQQNTVNVHVVSSNLEGIVVANVKRKERDAAMMAAEMVKHMESAMRDELTGSMMSAEYAERTATGKDWTMHNGDCVEVVGKMPNDSVDFTVFSPPFASLYTYSASDRDMGNCKDGDEFAAHFAFLVRELYRVTKPGRLLSFHCMNLPTTKARDGFIGIRDFRGEMIRLFESVGWIYHSEVCIWKDPVTAMQRTKAIGLLYKQLKKDSALSRQGIADYLVTVRKPGENPDPVTKTPDDFPVTLWQQYASPVWMDINPSDTLQFRSARQDEDERHIAPLQLEVIRRAVKLWSNPNDLVLTPFGGIGSELYVAVQEGRRAIGVELKRSYFDQACANLRQLEHERGAQGALFA